MHVPYSDHVYTPVVDGLKAARMQSLCTRLATITFAAPSLPCWSAAKAAIVVVEEHGGKSQS